MPNRRKRKQPQLRPPPSPPSKSPKTNAANQKDPYPNHPRPTPEECRSVRNDLLALHGFPKEFAKYRSLRPNLDPIPTLSNGSAQSPAKPEPVDGEDGGGACGPVESVLDGLVSTILSQNTTDLNSQRAFTSLKSAFPTWEDVSSTILFVFEFVSLIWAILHLYFRGLCLLGWLGFDLG